MKKLITILMLLLSVASQAQSLVFPVSDTTSVKAKLRGQSQQRTLVEVADGRVFAVGLLKSQELLTSATVVPTSRTITINGADGISISGGNTQNLSNNRTWSVGISSIDASKIGGGAVSNTEYSYIDGVTSSIQTQLNSKLAISTAASTYATITNLDTKYDASNPDNYTTFYTTNNGGLPIDNELMGKVGDIVLDVANGSFWSYAPVGMTNWWNVFSAYPYSNPLSFITSSTAASTYLSKSNNLSDLVSASTARTNLGLTTLATTTPATGVATFLSTPSSANLAAALTDETGTGAAVFANNSTLTGTTTTSVIANTAGANFATTSGSVGIGTASPASKLHINSASTVDVYARLTGTSSTNGGFFFGVGGANQVALVNRENTDMEFYNNNTLGVIFKASGRVGIGTSSPSTPLHISFPTTTPQPVLTLETVGTNGRPYINFRAEGTNYGYFGWGATSGKLSLMNYNNASIDIGTNSTTRMSVDGSGNVGIGTTSPSVILDINNTGAIKIPVGTDAQRPASPATGMLRVNTTASPAKLEYYNGSSWIQL